MRELQIKTEAEFKLAQKLRAKLNSRLLEIHKASLVIAGFDQSSNVVDVLSHATAVMDRQIRFIDEACNAWLRVIFGDVKDADCEETFRVEHALRNELVEHRRRRTRRPEQEYDNNANPIPFGTPTTPWFETGKPARSEAG